MTRDVGRPSAPGRLWGLAAVAVVVMAVAWLMITRRSDDRQAAATRQVETAAPEVPVELPTVPARPEPAPLSPSAPEPPSRDTVPEPTAPAAAAELQPGEGGRVAIAVVDARGEFVPDARVRVWVDQDTCHADSPATEEQRTDARGRAVLHMPTELSVLVAERDDLGTSGAWTYPDVHWAANAEGETRIELQSTSRVRGLVVEADDRPVAGATVKAWASGGHARDPRDVATDARGRFELVVDATDRLRLQAYDGDRPSALERTQLDAGTEREVTLRFPGDWGIEGLVQDADGHPAAGATIRLWLEVPGYAPRGRSPEQNCHTDETTSGVDGRFRFDVPRLAGYTLVASSSSGPSCEPAHVQVDAEHPRVSSLLTLPEASAIAGSLRWEDGTPIVGVTIKAIPEIGQSSLPNSNCYAPTELDRFGQANTVTEAEGRFRLEPLHPAGTYRLICRPDAEAPQRVVTRPDVQAGMLSLDWLVDAKDLVGAVVIGVVLTSESGATMPAYGVQLVERTESRMSFVPNKSAREDDGRFRIEGLKLGSEYGLEVFAEGWARTEVPWWTATDVPHEVVVRLERPGALDVEVRDAFGSPVGLASVMAARHDQIFNRVTRSPSQTGDAGRVQLDGLDPGTWTVTAALGERRATAEVTIAGGSTTRLRLDLPAP